MDRAKSRLGKFSGKWSIWFQFDQVQVLKSASANPSNTRPVLALFHLQNTCFATLQNSFSKATQILRYRQPSKSYSHGHFDHHCHFHGLLSLSLSLSRVTVTVTVTFGSAKPCMALTRAMGQRVVAHKFEFLAQFTLTNPRPIL
jgi:hypothetical protein